MQWNYVYSDFLYNRDERLSDVEMTFRRQSDIGFWWKKAKKLIVATTIIQDTWVQGCATINYLLSSQIQVMSGCDGNYSSAVEARNFT